VGPPKSDVNGAWPSASTGNIPRYAMLALAVAWANSQLLAAARGHGRKTERAANTVAERHRVVMTAATIAAIMASVETSNVSSVIASELV
jgi:hypothetical protein